MSSPDTSKARLRSNTSQPRNAESARSARLRPGSRGHSRRASRVHVFGRHGWPVTAVRRGEQGARLTAPPSHGVPQARTSERHKAAEGSEENGAVASPLLGSGVPAEALFETPALAGGIGFSAGEDVKGTFCDKQACQVPGEGALPSGDRGGHAGKTGRGHSSHRRMNSSSGLTSLTSAEHT